jgi:hypothetical protein
VNFLIKEYTKNEQASFKTFLVFSFFVLLVLIIAFYVFSEFWRVKIIEVEGSTYINEYQFLEFYNSSILTIEDDSFRYIKDSDQTVDYIKHEKIFPNELNITIAHHLQIAEITDLRKSIPTKVVLYKNLFVQEALLENDVVSVTITNGPVDEGFNGELVTLVMTLLNFEIEISEILLVHNGSSLMGSYRGIEINFLEPIDLSTKGSAIGELLEKTSCVTEVTFISINSFITDCNI